MALLGVLLAGSSVHADAQTHDNQAKRDDPEGTSRASCTRPAHGRYRFRRDNGNRVSLIAHSFDCKEHELRFTVIEYDSAQ